jgi:hypothetical protein
MGKVDISKVKRDEKICRGFFFRTCPPASNRPKGVGVMVKLGEKHPWKRGCAAEKVQGKCRAVFFYYRANRP